MDNEKNIKKLNKIFHKANTKLNEIDFARFMSFCYGVFSIKSTELEIGVIEKQLKNKFGLVVK